MQFFVDPEKIDGCNNFEKIKNIKINILDSKEKENALSLNEMLERKIFKNKWHAYWLYYSYKWFLDLGIRKENLRLREHRKDELAHYANAAVDIEYKFFSGWKEIFGSHDRGTFDLGEHEKLSKKDMKIFDEETKKKILPAVIESSFGVERAFIVFMFDSYYDDKERGNIILKLSPRLAPIKAAIFPIVKRPEFEKIAEEILKDLGEEWNVVYDKSGSIGRRYARNDEIGTPFCITIDKESLKKKDVTIRERDTTKQVRVKVSELRNVLRDLINKKLEFEDAGKLIK